MSSIIENIIVKFLTNQASITELEALTTWLEENSNEQVFNDFVKANYIIDSGIMNFNSENTKKHLLDTINKENKVIRFRYYKRLMAYAASVILLVVSAYFLKANILTDDLKMSEPSIVNNNIETGTDKATLTLEDGTEILLKKGKQFTHEELTSNGENLIYKKKQTKREIAYNYLTIPTGGQFRLVLDDGTQVWLNSESKLKYPKHFIDGEDRQVELVYGEAYFDVSPSTKHKGSIFKVITDQQEVKVLGTQFNIKAYSDEDNIYTTLIEGKIEVHNNNLDNILKPNQQFVLNKINNNVSISTVEDMYSVYAWKRGVFSFKDMPLKDIMKVLSRWYGTTVIFKEPKTEKTRFNGVLGKEQTIEDILNTIYITNNVLYEINNKTIIFN